MTKNKLRRMTCLAMLIAILGNVSYGLAADGAENTLVLAGQTITAESSGVTITGATATITQPGIYTLTGTLEQGKIVVNSGGDVTLILDNASVASADGPAIDIEAAGQVTLTLAAGTQNTISDSARYTDAADGQDAAIFSKADLIIGGEGALTVHALYNDGIASRDTLLIEGGTITVDAVSHGIKGKDYLMITGGTITVDAGGDAIKSTNDAQTGLGYVQIDGGTLTLTAKDDGISAVSAVTLAGADITITSDNNGMKSDGTVSILSGNVTINYGDDDFVCQAKELSPDATVTLNRI